ncbi:MAG: sigma-54 dependent transcriptional regulator [Desulfobaccales bacterium]|jgi:DNA-binding NtrC family response regulator
MSRYKILIVDDDKLLQNSLKNVLAEKYDTLVVGKGEDVLGLLRKNSVDLVLLDVRLPGQDGIETLKQIKALERDLLVIMMTAYEDIKTVITSMKIGAHDYLVKPLEIEELEIIVEKALDNLKLKKEVEELRQNYLKEFNVGNIIGESPAIKEAIEFANKVAKSYDTTVLIEGETGVGKEVIARTIQNRSARFNKPLVIINCGAISKDLVESEMFGYERGTFTGGLQEGKKGKLEMADGGTLLLDEISELLPSSQVKLLRFLEEKEFFPVGGTQKRKVDIRIIAATNKSLELECRAGRFREDLYYRLNVAQITIPPLRERQVDIIPLTLFFMNSFL